MDKICCGNCKYNEYELKSDDYVCGNTDSEFYSDYIDFENSCDEFCEREE